jgi:hypothetical protein
MNFSRLATSVAAPTYVCLLTLAPLSADAVEGALGRPISGTFVAPNAGVIPPEPQEHSTARHKRENEDVDY